MDAVAIVALIVAALVGFVKIVSDNRVRSKLIEKGMLDENVQFLYPKRLEYHVPTSLKWGLVLVGVGIAFLIGQMVPNNVSEEVTVGSMFILAGAGLLAYYVIASRMVKNMDKDQK